MLMFKFENLAERGGIFPPLLGCDERLFVIHVLVRVAGRIGAKSVIIMIKFFIFLYNVIGRFRMCAVCQVALIMVYLENNGHERCQFSSCFQFHDTTVDPP